MSKHPDFDRYVAACNYPGDLDEDAVERHLAEYITAIGTRREVRQLRRGWRLETEPALKNNIAQLIAESKKRQLNLSDQDKEQLVRWGFFRSSWWLNNELSYLASTHFGAKTGSKVAAWATPVFEAFCAGAWVLYWTKDVLYWVAKPTLKTETIGGRKRCHNETGPALDCAIEPLYFWHGVLVPAHWIEQRETLSPAEVIATKNVEQRAAGAAIVGWPKMLSVLNARVIHDSGIPSVGALIELELPGVPLPGLFLKAHCPRNGVIVEGVPHVSDIDGLPIDTAMAAQAWRIGYPQSEYQHPERRT